MSGTVETRTVSALAHINIFDVLEYYEVPFVGRVTQQILCPVHKDRTPSARVYGDNNQVYCFKCAKLWNPITLVQAKEHCQTERALELLEARFKIPGVSENLARIIKAQLKRAAPLNLTRLFEMAEADILSRRGVMTLDRYNRVWLALDLVQERLKAGAMPAEEAQEAVKTVLQYARGKAA